MYFFLLLPASTWRCCCLLLLLFVVACCSHKRTICIRNFIWHDTHRGRCWSCYNKWQSTERQCLTRHIPCTASSSNRAYPTVAAAAALTGYLLGWVQFMQLNIWLAFDIVAVAVVVVAVVVLFSLSCFVVAAASSCCCCCWPQTIWFAFDDVQQSVVHLSPLTARCTHSGRGGRQIDRERVREREREGKSERGGRRKAAVTTRVSCDWSRQRKTFSGTSKVSLPKNQVRLQLPSSLPLRLPLPLPLTTPLLPLSPAIQPLHLHSN